MSKSFSHLIWLGAGQAQEPSNLIEQAKRAILVDARESACEYLRQQFPSDQVSVVQQLLTAGGGQQNFTEYNLREYSAQQNAAGLKSIFPGLKTVSQEFMDSISIKQFFNDIALTDNNNILVVDLPDINLSFLKALHETDVFCRFSKIYVFANPEPLYVNSINASDVEIFLQSVGYLLQETLSTDPDFSCLTFGWNPLWLELQQVNNLNDGLINDAKELHAQQETLKQQLVEAKYQANQIAKENGLLKQQLTQQQQLKDSIEKELKSNTQLLVEVKQQSDQIAKECDALKQQLAQQQKSKDSAEKELQSNKQQLIETTQQLDKITKERELFKQQISNHQQQKDAQDKDQEKLKQKLTEEQKRLTEVNTLLDHATKQSAARKDTVGKLEKEKRELEETNKSLKLKQDLLEKELIKAEAQIDLIKILMVKA